MIETLVIGGSIGLMVSGVMLAISRNAWRKHARKLQQVISDYETELQTERNSWKRTAMELQEHRNNLAKQNASLIFDREVLRKQIAISEKTVTALRNDVAGFETLKQDAKAMTAEQDDLKRRLKIANDHCEEARELADEADTRAIDARKELSLLRDKVNTLEASEEMISESRKEIELLRAQIEGKQDGLRFAKEQRDKCESARIALSGQRDKLRGENANLTDELERIKASNAFLVRECEKMDSQLTAIKTALVTQPEPTE